MGEPGEAIVDDDISLPRKLLGVCLVVLLMGVMCFGVLCAGNWVAGKATEQLRVIEISEKLEGHAAGELVLYRLDRLGCANDRFDPCGIVSFVPFDLVLSERRYPALIRIPERSTLLSITRYSWPTYTVLSLYIIPVSNATPILQ